MSTPMLFRWREAVLSEHGPRDANTRLVLLAIAQHWQPEAERAWPSVDRLVEMTGLSRPTVVKHLNGADEAGWIDRTRNVGEGRGWRRNEYRATIPKAVKELNRPTGDAVKRVNRPDARGSKDERTDAVKQLNSNTQGNTSEKAVADTRTRAEADGAVIAAVEHFLEATGADWRLKATVATWAPALADDYVHLGRWLPLEVRRAGEWYQGVDKTPKAPDQAIRNWLRRADDNRASAEAQSAQPSQAARHGTRHDPRVMTAAELAEWDRTAVAPDSTAAESLFPTGTTGGAP